MYSLDHHQQLAYDHIMEHIKRPGSSRYFYITGSAGVGKTHLMNHLINSLPPDLEPVVLTWSGMAARQLTNASTIMSYCGLTFDSTGLVGDNAYMRDTPILQRRMVAYLRGKKTLPKKPVLFLDEVGALHSSILDALSGTFKELVPNGDRGKAFAGIVVVLCGDVCQLGRVELFDQSPAYPPGEYPTYPCWQSSTWEQMAPTALYLREFHRSGGEDIAYLELLEQIRSAPPLSPGVPRLPDQAARTLQKIRDRDGGGVCPR